MLTQDNVNLRGWFIYGNSPNAKKDGTILKEKTRYTDDKRPTLVFTHEQAGNLGLRIPFFKQICHKLEVNILCVAYRGFSYSDKVHINEKGLKKDAAAIIDFVRNPANVDEEIAQHMNPKLIFAHGRSLGGAVAMHIVSTAPELFRGLIVENSFTSIKDMCRAWFPWYIRWARPLVLRIKWKSDEIAPNLKHPVFYVTGDADETIPHEYTMRLHNLSTNAVSNELLVVPGGGHNDTWMRGRKVYIE